MIANIFAQILKSIVAPEMVGVGHWNAQPKYPCVVYTPNQYSKELYISGLSESATQKQDFDVDVVCSTIGEANDIAQSIFDKLHGYSGDDFGVKIALIQCEIDFDFFEPSVKKWLIQLSVTVFF